ncbi:glucosaminidase domain-containing protein [Lentibacillus sp. N15]|uniref:N-acetylglucosaminidase n=1 Tax=Lentibacillus songyuanensis TaxID=3136161 RepID=UPI0031BBC94C
MNHRSSSNIYNVRGKFIYIVVIATVEIALLLLIIHAYSDTEDGGSFYANMPVESSPPIEVQSTPEKPQQKAKEPSFDPDIIKSPTYYTVQDGMLSHHVTETSSFVYGPAADFMSEGQKYYSRNGHTFFNSDGKEVGTAYQYFEILPLNTDTSYTANQLNQFIKDNIPEGYRNQMGGPGPLATLGEAFISAQNQFGVNALYLLAHAIHESAWGSSAIAQTKHNLYGFGAIDSDPYNGAKKFNTFQDGIDYVSQFVANQYQDPKGAYYNGSMLGNKEMGMNVKYASDPFWGQEIAGYMYRIDQALGGKDFGRFNSEPYRLAVSTVSAPLNVRTQPSTSTSNDIAYHLPSSGTAMIVMDQIDNDDGTWFKIFSDESNFLSQETAYIYHKGPHGSLSETVTIAGGQ